MNKISIIIILPCIFLFVFMLISKGFNLDVLAGLFVLIGCLLILLYEDQIYNWIQNKKRKKVEGAHCRIEEDYFLFPSGYYFNHGYLKHRNKLPFAKVQEVRINTWPVSIKVNNNELIFLKGLETDVIKTTAKEHNMAIAEPQDNWDLLLEEFLDTEFSPAHKRATINSLINAGIPEAEINRIRRKFKFRMLLQTMFSLEWVYYGQFDVMQQIFPMTEKMYWWTMDIALRQKN